MKKVLMMACIGLVVAGAFTSCEGRKQSGTVRLRFANVTTEAGILAGEEFIRIAQEASGGTLVIDHFPRNQLGNDVAQVENTVVGDIDIAVSSTSSIAELFRDLFLFDMPFLFTDHEHAHRMLDGEATRRLLDGMERIGLKGIAMWENGFRNFTNDKVAVRVPADVRGMTVRTMVNPLHLSAWQLFGANPTPMAFGELFTALQQSTVDAQENPLGIIDANNFQSVQRYISLTQHVYTPFIVVMNLKKYNSLTDQQRAAIDRAARESTIFQRERALEDEIAIREKFMSEGVNVVELTPAEKTQWRNLIINSELINMVRDRMDNPQLLDAFID
ncbi:MAG: DctP family TRAP transporter solute-binding subunit [Treponema sp.]|nr:DctP family TRAP transporter solute-binding subunit [Treponema sp.]